MQQAPRECSIGDTNLWRTNNKLSAPYQTYATSIPRYKWLFDMNTLTREEERNKSTNATRINER